MKRALILRGLLFGDEGKGATVDALVAAIAKTYKQDTIASEVVREGGPQAAHWLVRKDGKKHRSAQIGSGIFTPGVRTFASKNMIISPGHLIKENLNLYEIGIRDGAKRMFIDPNCTVLTPLHQMIGRMLEISRIDQRHGSTGFGVGQAVYDRNINGKDVLCAGDLKDESTLKKKIEVLFSEKFSKAEELLRNNPGNTELKRAHKYYLNALSEKLLFNSYCSFATGFPLSILDSGEEYFSELLRGEKHIIFEGSQGALLDPRYGLRPYVTKMKTTFETAEELLEKRLSRSEIEKIGVLRAYSTRHGAGPFVTENKALSWMIPDEHNRTNPWQGKFRIGWFDLIAARYGILVNEGVDSIALTNLDRLSKFSRIKVCTSYEYLGKHESDLDEFFEWENSGNRIRITSILKPEVSQDGRISKILFECKPLDYAQFPGWKTNIENAKVRKDLPKEAIRYIEFLQSEEGLGNKISIVSVGPTSDNKIQYNSC